MKKILLCALSTFMVFSVTVYGEVTTEVRLNVDADAQGQPPKGGIKAFEDGDLYYNAIPSTPAKGSAIKVIDTEDDTDFICKIYKLKHDIGSELWEFLLTTVAKENGQIDLSVNTVTGVNYLVITAPIFQFPYLEAVISTLDQEGTNYDNNGKPSINYKMKHRLASEVAKFIVTSDLSPIGSAYADDEINVLYICDVPSYYQGALNDLEDFDVPPQMVRIEVQIVEIEMDSDFNFGLALDQWKEGLPEEVNMSFDFERGKDHAPRAATGDTIGTMKYLAQSLDLSGMRPKAVANMINFMVRTGRARVLSRPTVVAMNGQKAIIASLDNISYTAYSTSDEPLNKQAQTGIELIITPIIGTHSLSLEIDAVVHSLMGWAASSTPIINTRSTTANVVLMDGELFTLSGLRKDEVTKMDDRVPILGAIPLLGYFFRHEIDVKKTSEIVVLLTPRKVTPSDGIIERERELLKKTEEEMAAPAESGPKKFVDRVILNKKP